MIIRPTPKKETLESNQDYSDTGTIIYHNDDGSKSNNTGTVRIIDEDSKDQVIDTEYRGEFEIYMQMYKEFNRKYELMQLEVNFYS